MSSVSVLLDPETKLTQWSALNCYHLNVANLNADVIEHGSLAPTINDVTNANIAFASGSGTISVSQSLFSRYKNGLGNNNEYIFASGSFRIDNVAAPLVGTGRSLLILTVTLPFKIDSSMTTPGGGSNSIIRAVPTLTTQVFSSTQVQYQNNGGDLNIFIFVQDNISVADPVRSLVFHIH